MICHAAAWPLSLQKHFPTMFLLCSNLEMTRSDSPRSIKKTPSAPDFTPVPLRARHDGWTPERQRTFIHWLAKGLRPGRAAERVGMSRKSAYALRARPGGEGFAAAWDAAVAGARRRKADLRTPGDFARGVEGILHPVRYRGRITAWDRRFDDGALLRLLRRTQRLIENR